MMEDAKLLDMYMNPGRPDITLASSLKKVLLAREEMLPVAAVQCVSTVLTSTRGHHYADLLLQQDMAGGDLNLCCIIMANMSTKYGSFGIVNFRDSILGFPCLEKWFQFILEVRKELFVP